MLPLTKNPNLFNMKKLAVVAFGGNALLEEIRKGPIDKQRKNVSDTCMSLLKLIKNNYNIVGTHGNGPQFGNILLQNCRALKPMACPKSFWIYAVQFSQGFHRLYDRTTTQEYTGRKRN